MPLNLPSGHPPDCLCQRCWPEKIGGWRHTRDILEALASELSGLGFNSCVFLLWLVNDKLARPLSESEIEALAAEATGNHQALKRPKQRRLEVAL